MTHLHQTTRRAKRTLAKQITLSISTLATLGLVTLGTGTAMAETRVETVLGTVTQSDPIRSSYVRKTPKDERVCRTEDVPIYGESQSGQSDLGAMIVGGLIGSAIGNKLSDNEGAGAAGTVAGAILGREHA